MTCRRLVFGAGSFLFLVLSAGSSWAIEYDGPALPDGWHPIHQAQIAEIREASLKQEEELMKAKEELSSARDELSEVRNISMQLSVTVERLETSLIRLSNRVKMWQTGTIVATSVGAVGWLLFLLSR